MFVRSMGTAVLLCLAFAHPILAQTPTGEISGIVVEPSGSAVPGVTITLTSKTTNAVREVVTNGAGLYVIPAIPPGLYTLKAQISGFRVMERRDIEIQVGSANRIPIILELGDLTEVVEIRGGSPLVQSSNASIGTVIENRSIVELPLNGRNYLQLASLIPGATTNGPSSSQGRQRMGGQRNSFALNVAGQRIHYNHYSLDGVENTDLNFNSYMLLPSVDALQEFKVEAGLFDAEYGRAIAQVNVSTRSGTNQLHGTAFEFLRNSALDAKNYFDRKDQPIPPFKRNQFGATLGGPISRDRIHYFVSYERQIYDDVVTVNIPAFVLPIITDPRTEVPRPLRQHNLFGKVTATLSPRHYVNVTGMYGKQDRKAQDLGGNVAGDGGFDEDAYDVYLAGALTSVLSSTFTNQLRVAYSDAVKDRFPSGRRLGGRAPRSAG